MPSKRVIVLNKTGAKQFLVAFWADVPAARQAFYANAAAVSAWSGASEQEIAAIRTGAVAESVQTIQSEGTVAEFRTELETQWTRFQAEINASNPWNRYGTYWVGDGSSWVNGGAS